MYCWSIPIGIFCLHLQTKKCRIKWRFFTMCTGKQLNFAQPYFYNPGITLPPNEEILMCVTCSIFFASLSSLYTRSDYHDFAFCLISAIISYWLLMVKEFQKLQCFFTSWAKFESLKISFLWLFSNLQILVIWSIFLHIMHNFNYQMQWLL